MAQGVGHVLLGGVNKHISQMLASWVSQEGESLVKRDLKFLVIGQRKNAGGKPG